MSSDRDLRLLAVYSQLLLRQRGSDVTKSYKVTSEKREDRPGSSFTTPLLLELRSTP